MLLAVLDINKLVELLKASESLSKETHQLGSHSDREEVDKSLQALAETHLCGPGSMVPPLFLAWATFLFLSNSLEGSGWHRLLLEWQKIFDSVFCDACLIINKEDESKTLLQRSVAYQGLKAQLPCRI